MLTFRMGNMPLEPVYRYNALISDVYDGDTVTVHVDLGLEQWAVFQKCRLMGINAPELVEEGGKASRDYLRELIADYSLPCEPRFAKLGTRLLVETHKLNSLIAGRMREKREKYGRWLLTLFGADPVTKDSVTINDRMVASGYAKRYALS